MSVDAVVAKRAYGSLEEAIAAGNQLHARAAEWTRRRASLRERALELYDRAFGNADGLSRNMTVLDSPFDNVEVSTELLNSLTAKGMKPSEAMAALARMKGAKLADGTFAVFLDNADSLADLASTIRHEGLHVGFARNLQDADKAEFLRRAQGVLGDRMVDAMGRRIDADTFAKMSEAEQEVAIDETLAALAETHARHPKLMGRIAQAVGGLFGKNGQLDGMSAREREEEARRIINAAFFRVNDPTRTDAEAVNRRAQNRAKAENATFSTQEAQQGQATDGQAEQTQAEQTEPTQATATSATDGQAAETSTQTAQPKQTEQRNYEAEWAEEDEVLRNPPPDPLKDMGKPETQEVDPSVYTRDNVETVTYTLDPDEMDDFMREHPDWAIKFVDLPNGKIQAIVTRETEEGFTEDDYDAVLQNPPPIPTITEGTAPATQDAREPGTEAAEEGNRSENPNSSTGPTEAAEDGGVQEPARDGETQEAQGDDGVRYRVSKRAAEGFLKSVERRQDLYDEDREQAQKFLKRLQDMSEDRTKYVVVATKWMNDGKILLPQDHLLVSRAIDVAQRHKVDPAQFKSPADLLVALEPPVPAMNAIDPDTVKAFSRKQVLPGGVTVYSVKDTPEGQQAVIDVVRTHLVKEGGKPWGSPWCLSTFTGEGKATESAKHYWKQYGARPKKIAFKDGKLVAFHADDARGTPGWWGLMEGTESVSLKEAIEEQGDDSLYGGSSEYTQNGVRTIVSSDNGNTYIRERTMFNERGAEETTTYRPDGTRELVFEEKADEARLEEFWPNGMLRRRRTKSHLQALPLTDEEYDEQGKLRRKDEPHPENYSWRMRTIYGEDGRAIERQEIFYDGSIVERHPIGEGDERGGADGNVRYRMAPPPGVEVVSLPKNPSVSAGEVKDGLRAFAEDWKRRKGLVYGNEQTLNKILAGAEKFIDLYFGKTVTLQNGGIMRFSPDVRAVERLGSERAAWQEYAIHAATNDRTRKDGVHERTLSTKKVIAMKDIERVLREENVFASIRENTPEKDSIVFVGSIGDGKRLEVITRMDEIGNVMADLSEITAIPKYSKRKIPPTIPLSAAVEQVAQHQGAGSSPSTEDSKAQGASAVKPGVDGPVPVSAEAFAKAKRVRLEDGSEMVGPTRFRIGPLYTGAGVAYDRPDISFVGTGEGAHVYGWGLYASNQFGVAKSYAEDRRIENSSLRYVGNRFDYSDDDFYEVLKSLNYYYLKTGSNIEQTLKELEYLYRYNIDYQSSIVKDDIESRNYLEKTKAKLEILRALRPEDFMTGPQTAIHKQTWFTNRPDGDRSHLLAWQGKIREEQLGWIRAQAEKEGVSLPESEYDFFDGGTLYESLSKSLGSKQAASEFLYRAGIDGVMYPVNASRGGTYLDGINYVAFSDEHAQVDKRWVWDGKKYAEDASFRPTAADGTRYRLGNEGGPDLRAGLDAWMREMVQEREQARRADAADEASANGRPEALRSKGKKIYDWFRRKMINDQVPVFDAIRRVMGKRTAADAENVEAAAKNVHGRIMAGQQFIQHAFVDKITAILSEPGMDRALFDEYLYALFAPERNRQILERTAKEDPVTGELLGDRNGSGMSEERARQIIAKVEADPKAARYKAAAELVHKMNRRTAWQMAEYGFVTKGQVAAWFAQSPHYVPLKDAQAKAWSLRHSVGRFDEADSPLVNSIRQAYETVRNGELNGVNRTMAAWLRKYDPTGASLGGRVEDSPGETRRVREGKPEFIRFGTPAYEELRAAGVRMRPTEDGKGVLVDTGHLPRALRVVTAFMPHRRRGRPHLRGGHARQ